MKYYDWLWNFIKYPTEQAVQDPGTIMAMVLLWGLFWFILAISSNIDNWADKNPHSMALFVIFTLFLIPIIHVVIVILFVYLLIHTISEAKKEWTTH